MSSTRYLTIALIAGLAIAGAGDGAFAQGGGKGGGKGGGGGGGGDDGGAPGPAEFVAVTSSGSGYALVSLDAAGVIVDTLSDPAFLPTHPADNPDATEVAFYSSNAIYVSPADASTGPSLLTSTSNSLTGLAWSPVPTPDGASKIAWTDNAADTTLIHLINEDGTGSSTLDLGPWNIIPMGGLEFSPDGRTLGLLGALFDGWPPLADNYLGNGIVLVELMDAGGTLAIADVTVPVDETFGVTGPPTWLPSSDIVFTANGPAGKGLYRLDLTVGTPDLILAERSFGSADYAIELPAGDPLTGRIVFVGPKYRKNGGYSGRQLFTCDADGSNVVQLTSKGYWMSPRWL